MMEVFSTELLEMMHKDMLERFTEQETEFDFKIFTKLTLIVKVWFFPFSILWKIFS